VTPSRWALALAALWGVAGGAACLAPVWLPAWERLGIGLGAVFALDALAAALASAPTVTRRVAPALSRGVWARVELALESASRLRLSLRIHDHHPPGVAIRGLPAEIALPPRGRAELTYRLRPEARGEVCFGPVELRVASPLRLLDRHVRTGEPQRVRVQPNIRALARYRMLAAESRTAALGVKKRPRRGDGLEFHQLRDYRPGDALRQIDWKATARLRRVISREYQDERDQRVVFLLDCSHRLRAKDGERSHFDAALDALLLAAQVAVRQGDAVGLMTFSGEQRWLAPRKGARQLHALLGALYDLETSPSAPDYLEAARELRTRLPKRALVVLITNVRDEDGAELEPALHLLARSHLVVLASLAESAMSEALAAPVRNLDDALRVASVHAYRAERTQALKRVVARGALLVDCEPDALPIALVNRYLEVKASARL
jgi:uncharacterized protein (DUF58 family)